jgi:hypothetical protein
MRLFFIGVPWTWIWIVGGETNQGREISKDEPRSPEVVVLLCSSTRRSARDGSRQRAANLAGRKPPRRVDQERGRRRGIRRSIGRSPRPAGAGPPSARARGYMGGVRTAGAAASGCPDEYLRGDTSIGRDATRWPSPPLYGWWSRGVRQVPSRALATPTSRHVVVLPREHLGVSSCSTQSGGAPLQPLGIQLLCITGLSTSLFEAHTRQAANTPKYPTTTQMIHNPVHLGVRIRLHVPGSRTVPSYVLFLI